MPEGQGAPASPPAAPSAPDRGWSGPAVGPAPRRSALAPSESPVSPAPRRGAVCAGVPQKLAEALSSQYGLNVFVAGLLLLLAWAVHASGVGKGGLLCFLTALMLLQLLWMLWYVGRGAARRRLPRLKDTHAGARWLRGESPSGERVRGAQPARPPAAALRPSRPVTPSRQSFLPPSSGASFLALPSYVLPFLFAISVKPGFCRRLFSPPSGS